MRSTRYKLNGKNFIYFFLLLESFLYPFFAFFVFFFKYLLFLTYHHLFFILCVYFSPFPFPSFVLFAILSLVPPPSLSFLLTNLSLSPFFYHFPFYLSSLLYLCILLYFIPLFVLSMFPSIVIVTLKRLLSASYCSGTQFPGRAKSDRKRDKAIVAKCVGLL
jgi:hypothetical protein